MVGLSKGNLSANAREEVMFKTPADKLQKGIKIIEPFLSEKGFIYEVMKKGSWHYQGEDVALGVFRKNNLGIEIIFMYNIHSVKYSDNKATVSHRNYMDILGYGNQCRYRGFQITPWINEFHNLLYDLQHFGKDFFEGGHSLHKAAKKSFMMNIKKILRIIN